VYKPRRKLRHPKFELVLLESVTIPNSYLGFWKVFRKPSWLPFMTRTRVGPRIEQPNTASHRLP